MRSIVNRRMETLWFGLILAVNFVFIVCPAYSDERLDTSQARPKLTTGLSSDLVVQGEAITLKWNSHNADKITLMPRNVELEDNGALKFVPLKSTQYTVTAVNKHGSTIQRLNVKVFTNISAPTVPNILSVFATGSSVSLNWTASQDDKTPVEMILYQIFYSNSHSSIDQLTYLGEVQGLNNFSADNLPVSERLLFYVVAIDSTGNKSNFGEGAALTTSSAEPVLRDDLIVIDLEEVGAEYEKPNSTTLIVKNYSSIGNLSIDDIVISYREDDSFVGKIVERTIVNSKLRLTITQMSIFELFSKGEFNMTLKANKVNEAEED